MVVGAEMRVCLRSYDPLFIHSIYKHYGWRKILSRY